MPSRDRIRRFERAEETLLIDGDGRRVVRLRGPARTAIELATTREERTAREHLDALGVLSAAGSIGAVGDGAPDRRTVLTAGAAAALGITVMTLPAAAAATSVGSQAVRTGFVQVGEFVEPGGTAVGGDLTRSFVHGGLIHLFDPYAPWRLYVITSGLDAVQVVSITGVPDSSTWPYDSSQFLVVGDFAYIAATRVAGDWPDQVAHLDTVRLSLPLAPVGGEVAATVWSVDLSSRMGAEDMTGRSWSFTDAGGVTRTVDGGSLTVQYSGGPTTSTVTWDAAFPYQLGRIAHDGTNLDYVLSYRTADEYETTYQYTDGGGVTRNESVFFRLQKWELLRVSTSNPATRTFSTLNIDLSYSGGSTFSPRSLVVDMITPQVDLYSAFAALVRSGTLILLMSGTTSMDALRIPLSAPSTWSVVRDVALPAGLTRVWVPSTDDGEAAAQLSADRLLIPAEVQLASDASYRAAVLQMDLTQTSLPVDDHVLLAGSGSYSSGPVALDATYAYVGLWDTDGRFAVARLTRSPLALDSVASTELDGFAEHYAYTAQPTASGVLMAGSGSAPVATFAFVAPS